MKTHKTLCISWKADEVEETQKKIRVTRYNTSAFFRILFADWVKNGSESIPHEDSNLDS